MVEWAPLIGAGIGALGNYFGSKDIADNQYKTNQLNVAAREKDREAGLHSLQQNNPLFQSIRNAQGGYDVKQPGDSLAGEVADLGAYGDKQRMTNINNIDSDVRNPFPTFESARASEIGRQGKVQGLQDSIYNKFVEQGMRQGGRDNNTGFDANFQKQAFDLAQANASDTDTNALGLMKEAANTTNLLKNQIIANNSLQRPAPGLTNTGPGGAAASTIASIPSFTQSANLSGASLPMSIGALGKDIGAIYQRDEDRALMDRYLKNQASKIG